MTNTELKTVLEFLKDTGTCSHVQLSVLSDYITFKIPKIEERETVEVVAELRDPDDDRFIVYQKGRRLFYYWGV